MIKLEVKNRWSGQVQFTAEIDCDESRTRSFKLGLAVKWAVKNGADLGGAHLGGAYLGGAHLGGADLRGAYLRGAYLRGAYLRDADLRGAYLRDADLRGAYLGGAYLGGAYLRGADLGGADLGGADLGGADLGGLKIIQGPVREDGYQYILYTSALGGCVIKAGCRTWIGGDAIEQAREHCRDTTDEKHEAQALRIVDYLDGELRAIRSLDAFSSELKVAV